MEPQKQIYLFALQKIVKKVVVEGYIRQFEIKIGLLRRPSRNRLSPHFVRLTSRIRSKSAVEWCPEVSDPRSLNIFLQFKFVFYPSNLMILLVFIYVLMLMVACLVCIIIMSEQLFEGCLMVFIDLSLDSRLNGNIVMRVKAVANSLVTD